MAKKECPFCRKRINVNSVVCKYCNKDLTKPPNTLLRGNVLIALVIIVVILGLWILMHLSSKETSSQYHPKTSSIEKQVVETEIPPPQAPQTIISSDQIEPPKQPDESVVSAGKIVQDTCSEEDRLVIIPDIAVRHSKDMDRVLFFDTSQSYCYGIVNCEKKEHDCSYKWDFGGSGNIVGGNGNDIIVYRYDNIGEYEASVYMTESVSGREASDFIQVTAEAVQPVLPPLEFGIAVEESKVVLSVDGLTNIDQLFVVWGDRSRSEFSSPFNERIEHVYRQSGKYRLRVQVVDNEGNIFNYTAFDNANLIVEIQ